MQKLIKCHTIYVGITFDKDAGNGSCVTLTELCCAHVSTTFMSKATQHAH